MGDGRTEVRQAARLVVKVGSSSLTSAEGGLDPPRLEQLAAALAARKAAGAELVLVSSGAIAAGLAPLNLARRPRDLATAQAAASVGQSLLMARYTVAFAGHDITIAQILLTAADVTRRSHYRNAQRTLYRLLSLGVLPVVNENDTVATDEIRFGDNDRLAALVAHLVHADLLVLLSDVDGLYDTDPRRPGATLISEVMDSVELAGIGLGKPRSTGLGTGGMATKVDAARIATATGIPTVLSAASDAVAAMDGVPVGTYFHPTGRRTPTRLLWLAHASAPRGRLHLDAGAVEAVVRRRLSLLPAGVTGADGAFAAGDPVDLVDEDGQPVARGLVNFDAGELPLLLGRQTRELADEYGPSFSREIVHRDDLVVLHPAARRSGIVPLP